MTVGLEESPAGVSDTSLALCISEERGLGLLPERREPWTYYTTGSAPELSGFAGFFANMQEVEKFIRALNSKQPG